MKGSTLMTVHGYAMYTVSSTSLFIFFC